MAHINVKTYYRNFDAIYLFLAHHLFVTLFDQCMFATHALLLVGWSSQDDNALCTAYVLVCYVHDKYKKCIFY